LNFGAWNQKNNVRGRGESSGDCVALVGAEAAISVVFIGMRQLDANRYAAVSGGPKARLNGF